MPMAYWYSLKVDGNNINIHCKLLSPEGKLLADVNKTTDKNNAINTAKVIGTKLREDTL